MSNFSTKFVSQTGVGASSTILFTNVVDDFAMLLNAYVTGTATYTIEYTIDPDLNTAQYVPLGDANKTASSDESFYFPVKAVRVNVAAGDGTVKLVAMYKD